MYYIVRWYFAYIPVLVVECSVAAHNLIASPLLLAIWSTWVSTVEWWLSPVYPMTFGPVHLRARLQLGRCWLIITSISHRRPVRVWRNRGPGLCVMYNYCLELLRETILRRQWRHTYCAMFRQPLSIPDVLCSVCTWVLRRGSLGAPCQMFVLFHLSLCRSLLI